MESLGTALVTGASSGIGSAFARALATRGGDLVLVARRRERLEALAAELRAEHGVRVWVTPADLGARDGVATLVAELEAQGLTIDLVVNNAGVGYYGDLAAMAPDRVMAMVDVNVRALTELSHALLPGMIERRRGALINVASLAAFQAIPYGAVYAASKAYVLALTEAIAAEAAAYGIRVLCLCPGSTESEIHDHSGVDPVLVRTAPMMKAEEVVEEALLALARRRTVHVPGFLNEVSAQLAQLLPRPVASAVAGAIFRPKR